MTPTTRLFVICDDDPTTRRAIEKILAKEEEHADDMKKILDSLSESELNAAKPLK